MQARGQAGRAGKTGLTPQEGNPQGTPQRSKRGTPDEHCISKHTACMYQRSDASLVVDGRIERTNLGLYAVSAAPARPRPSTAASVAAEGVAGGRSGGRGRGIRV